jgi:hypothetical protein
MTGARLHMRRVGKGPALFSVMFDVFIVPLHFEKRADLRILTGRGRELTLNLILYTSVPRQ